MEMTPHRYRLIRRNVAEYISTSLGDKVSKLCPSSLLFLTRRFGFQFFIISESTKLSKRYSIIYCKSFKEIFERIIKSLLKMSRFNVKMSIDPLKFHRSVRDYPYYTFATDFIYFIMQKCGLDWVPLPMDHVLGITNKIQPRPNTYSPHPLSPCSIHIRSAVVKLLRGNGCNFERSYAKLVTDSNSKLESFQEHVRKVLAMLIVVRGSADETLFKLFYVGKLTAVFYGHGTSPVADIAPIIITSALREVNGTDSPIDWFAAIDNASKVVVSLYEAEPGLIIHVYDSGEENSAEENSAEDSSDSSEDDVSTSSDEREGNVSEEEDGTTSDEISDEREGNVGEVGEDVGTTSDEIFNERGGNVGEEEGGTTSDEIFNEREGNVGKVEEEGGTISDEIANEREGNSAKVENVSKTECKSGENFDDSSQRDESCTKMEF